MTPDNRTHPQPNETNKQGLLEPIIYNTEKRPDPYRPFSYRTFDNDLIYRRTQTKLLEQLPFNHSDAGGVILDLGCATGGVTKILTDLYEKHDIFVSILGVDIDREAITEARQTVRSTDRVSVAFREGDATNLPLADKSIRRVFFLGAFHEIQGGDENGVERKDKALDEVFRVLEDETEVIIISGFTGEVFDFVDPKTGKPAGFAEARKHGKIRLQAIKKLGREKAKGAAQFELLSASEIGDKLKHSGFVIDPETYVTILKADLDINSMRAIGEDLMWTLGIFQDMEGTDEISPYAKREAYLQALDDMEAAYRAEIGDPNAIMPFSRNFVMVKARKPHSEELQIPEKIASTVIFSREEKLAA